VSYLQSRGYKTKSTAALNTAPAPRTLQVKELKSTNEIEQIFNIKRNLDVEKVFPSPNGSDVMPDDLIKIMLTD
jgi:hypothetical protein